uniref:Sushi domain-containing protein n=1 Tax=Athene cunicularia TaxID=194338 RepID=A0A663MDK6_ATHCN
ITVFFLCLHPACLSCLILMSLNQEHINEIAFSVGKTVQYTCRPGYAKHPGMSPTITCLESGVWSEALEFCKTGCNAPTQLEFAELKELYGNQTVFPVGRTVEYVCRPGYAQHPGMPPAITCLRNQTWSAALEFCKRKKCPNPGDPENGRAVVLTDLLFGSKYYCDRGYVLTGKTTVSCLTSGIWSIPYPRCEGDATRAMCCGAAVKPSASPTAAGYPLSPPASQVSVGTSGLGRRMLRAIPVPEGTEVVLTASLASLQVWQFFVKLCVFQHWAKSLKRRSLSLPC